MSWLGRALKVFALAPVLGACGAEPGRPVSPTGMKAYELSLATSGQRAAVAWHGGVDGPDALYLQPLDARGRPASAPDKATSGHRSLEPDLQLVAGDPVLAWYDKDSRTTPPVAWLARLDGEGRTLWRHRLGGPGGAGRNTIVRAAGNILYVAWIAVPAPNAARQPVMAARFDASGAVLSPPRIIGMAGATTWNLNAALDADGRFYVVYDARLEAKANELHLSVLAPGGVTALQLSADDGHASLYPDLAIGASGQAALTWFDERDGNAEVYLSVAPLDALTRPGPRAARRITHTAAASIGAYLAWNGDRLALLWCDGEAGQNELYARQFRADGTPASPTERLTRTATQSSIPSVRPWGAGFMVAWNEYQPAGEGAHGGVASSVGMTLRLKAAH